LKEEETFCRAQKAVRRHPERRNLKQFCRAGFYQWTIMNRFPRPALATALIVIEMLVILALAAPMAPLHRGDAAAFWSRATGVDAPSTFGGIYAPRDGAYLYYDQANTGQNIFWVPAAEVIADFPRVIGRVRETEYPSNGLGRICWTIAALEHDPSAADDPDKFLAAIREQMLNAAKERDERIHRFFLDQERTFSNWWMQIRDYWMNFVFESVFFAGLTLFALQPWLRKRGAVQFAVHLAFVPLLLFVPFYLGYCGWCFTSIGPRGGILYPWVLMQFRPLAKSTPLDEWLLGRLPQVLAPMTQSPGPIMSIRGGQSFGPSAAMLTGAIIFFAVWAPCVLIAERRAANRRVKQI
jgi:hypothetical protein